MGREKKKKRRLIENRPWKQEKQKPGKEGVEAAAAAAAGKEEVLEQQ
jgi:hypothetical protein